MGRLEKEKKEEAVKNVSHELDLQLGTSPASARILDILAASGSRPLLKEAVGIGAVAAPLRGSLEMVMEEEVSDLASEEVTGPTTILEEIIAIATSGAEGPSDGPPTVTNLTEGFLGHSSPSGSQMDAHHFLAAQEDAPTSNRQSKTFFNSVALTFFSNRPKKVFLSPAHLWLEEEGLPTAEREARDKAFGGEMDEEGLTRRAMETWKRMSVEEKAVWRKRAKEAEGASYTKN